MRTITGGCQCGAVRYELRAEPKSTFCHCRMCQRASGGVFAALCMVNRRDLNWTAGQPTYYASSNVARRGFCPKCGTPLTFEYLAKDRVEVTTGSLDDPTAVGLVEHFGVEGKMPWLKLCDGLPESRTGDNSTHPANQSDFHSLQDASQRDGA